jgi:two-component system, NarL family, response regulator DevR
VLEIDRTRIMIIGGQRLIADALAAILNRESDMSVVGNLVSVAESRAHAAALKPHVVISEFKLEDGTAADVASSLSRAGIDARMIFLATEHSDTVLLAAIDASASAVVYQSAPAADLINAVRSVAAGLTLIQPSEVSRLLRNWQLRDHARRVLTNREREVLRLMAEGLVNREIAVRMGVSYFTIRTHVRNLASKLAARSQLETLVRAQKLDLIDSSVHSAQLVVAARSSRPHRGPPQD